MARKTIFDADFRYRNADTTDVRLTYARIRREQRKVERRKEHDAVAVLPISSPDSTGGEFGLDGRPLGSYFVPSCELRDAGVGEKKIDA